ncbi:MAG: transferrin receptor-like dimerization domain-containing protein [Thermoanaerobaculia bacterium]
MRTGLTVAMIAVAAVAAAAPEGTLTGFGPEQSVDQHDLEARFDAQLSADEIGEWIRVLSARPHHVGSAFGEENARRIADLFRSWGWDTEIETFQVLFPTPRSRRLELLEPRPFTARLEEDVLPEDSTSGQTGEQLPPYNAYSVDGDVTGDLVYVNYGVPGDYEELARRGIDVEGKIVIARYGGSWRGIKPKVAAEKGAIGCILYSDPRDDGYFQGDTYPEGGFRPEQGAQRGSVADMPLYPGDPLTPGVGATEDAERLPREEAPTLTKIPVLPISWSDAEPLLEALGGPVAPEAWRGALPLTYHLGPGPAKVHLQLEFDWSLTPAHDVIARMEGSELPDQWIVRGNHHDAWVNGATDPVSGMAAVLAEAKALGALHAEGWRPRRTIVYAAWDAEEPGLLGSVEWVERHAAELREKALVYVNSDSNERGFLYADGSHTLEPFVNEVARDVGDPETGASVWERSRAAMLLYGDPDTRARVEKGGDLPLAPLGSGSDYTPFLQHLGIASLNIGFGGEGDYGQYHSIYDSWDHYRRFMDPSFHYGVALAQVGGRLVLRLADAPQPPLRFGSLADTVGGYVDEVMKLADSTRDETKRENGRIEEGVYALAWDPEDRWTAPEPEEEVPYLNFAPLENALARLHESATAYDEAVASIDPAAMSAQQRAELGRALIGVERSLTRSEGLPRRSWFVHYVYAPGFYTGYGVKTLPGVREAIEQREWEEAGEQIQVAGEVLDAAADAIDAARETLRAGS